MTQTLGAWLVAEAALGLLERFPIAPALEGGSVESEEKVMAQQEHLMMQGHFATAATSGSGSGLVGGGGERPPPPPPAPAAQGDQLPDWVKASFLEAQAERDQSQSQTNADDEAAAEAGEAGAAAGMIDAPPLELKGGA
jgi:hypothetical protein